jgi:hypothetical protein
MNKRIIAMWVGIVLLVGSWLCPPWQETYFSDGEEWRTQPRGFHFIFNEFDHNEPPLDEMRLLLIDLSIALLTAGAMATLTQRKG